MGASADGADITTFLAPPFNTNKKNKKLKLTMHIVKDRERERKKVDKTN